MEDNTQSGPKKDIKPFALGGTLVVIVLSIIVMLRQDPQNSSQNVSQNVTRTIQPSTTRSGSTQVTAYKDGQYTESGNYFTPGGPEEIMVTVSLQNNTITQAQIKQQGNHPTSRVFQAVFATGYRQQVIGKNIDQVHLTRVSGSSLTPLGFNAALEKIKTNAKL